MAILDITFYSGALHHESRMTAIIPIDTPDIPGLPKPDTGKPLRSLYLLHGYSGGHSDWLRGSRIEQLAMMHNIAVFCPDGANSFYLDDPACDAFYGKLLGEELVELTRKLFHLSDRREDTVIGGFSMGGYGAIRNGLKYNAVFGSIIALSSALIIDNVARGTEDNPMISAAYFEHTFGPKEKLIGSEADPKALAKRLVDAGGICPKLFMACGTEDFLNVNNRDLDEYLTGIGYDHVYLEGPGMHGWDFWDPYIEKALDWLDGKKA